MDVVNTLWRSRALAQKEGEQSCLMDEVECRRRAILGSATVKTADEETRDLLDKLRAGFATRIQGALAPELCTPATIPECLTLAQSWFASGFARAFLEVRGEEAMDRGTEEAAAAVKVCRGPALPGDT
jgi:predicted RecB family nuclease